MQPIKKLFMSKKYFVLILLFCQLLSFAKTGNVPFVYTDSSVKDLNISDQPDVKGVHLFSHGKPGELLIEGKWLNAEAIAQRFTREVIGQSELYIYGCNFAQGEKGLAAVQYLERTLNVAVSASTNTTGIDGDWKLEVGNGKNPLSVNNFKGNLQLDNTHYLNPIVAGNYNTSTSISEEWIYLSTPSAAEITVQMNFANGVNAPRVKVYSNLNNPTPSEQIVANGVLKLSNMNPIRIQFVNTLDAVLLPGSSPITVPLNTAGTIIPGSAQGLIFNSVNKFYLNYRARSQNQAGSALTKGKVALGKEFRWGGSPFEFATTTVDLGNTLSIMATQNGPTTVIISNIKAGTKFVNGNGGTTLVGPSITKVLQKGESFILYAPVQISSATSPQNSGWLGAKVTSDQDVSVIVGGLMQQGNAADDRDIGLDQLVPKDRLGLEHVVMQGNGGVAEKVIVVATESNTAVFVGAGTTAFANLANAGDYVLIPSTSFVNQNMFVRVSKPSYVFHKIFGSSAINTNSLMFIPPLSCFGQKEVDLVPDARKIGTIDYTASELIVLAAAGTANKPLVLINGNAISSSPANSTGALVVGTNSWVSYRYPLTSNGRLKVSSAGTIQAEIIGASGVAGFGGYYSGFGETPIYMISMDTPYSYPCVAKTKMTIPAGLGSYQWYRNGVAIAGATTNSYTLNPTNDAVSANYYATVTFAGNCSVRSNELVSDICPCPKPGIGGTPDSYTDFGISIRDKRSTSNWPKDIANGFIALESNTKGFVITRMLSPENSISDPRPGMLVYDTDEDCLKLFNGTSWKCVKQTCND